MAGNKCLMILAPGAMPQAKSVRPTKGVYGPPFAALTIALCSIFRVEAISGNETSRNCRFCSILPYFALFCSILLFCALFCSFSRAGLICTILHHAILFCSILLYFALFCFFLLFFGQTMLHYFAPFCSFLLYFAPWPR